MKIDITREKIGYSATITDYRICTQGDSLDELIMNLKEALELQHEGETKLKNFNNMESFSLVI